MILIGGGSSIPDHKKDPLKDPQKMTSKMISLESSVTLEKEVASDSK